MTNAWKLGQQAPAKKAWSGEVNSGTSVTRTAPFGTSDAPVEYSTHLRPASNQRDALKSSSAMKPAGAQSWPG